MTRLKFLLTTTALLLAVLIPANIITETAAEKQALEQELERQRMEQEAKIEAEREAREQAEQRAEEYREILINRARTYEIFAAAPERPLSRARVITPTSAPVVLPSGFTADMLECAFEQIAPGMIGTGEAFIEAEKEYGINALVLAGICHLESGGGMSKIAQDKGNLAGIGAYDHDPYNCAFSFDDRAESIFYLAELLVEKYSPGGKYFGGSFDLDGINEHYASSGQWAEKVAGRMQLICNAAMDNPGELLAAAGVAA